MIKKVSFGILVLVMLFVSSTSVAGAQTTNREQLLVQIQQLLTLITELQTQLQSMREVNNTEVMPSAGDLYFDNIFAVGDSVQAVYDSTIHSFAGFNNRVVGEQARGNQGVITDGPRKSTDGLEGTRWWQVAFENGVEGWIGQNRLTNTIEQLSDDTVTVLGNTIDASIEVPERVVAGEKTNITADVFSTAWDPTYRFVLHFGDESSTFVVRRSDSSAHYDSTHTYKVPGEYTIAITYTDWGSTSPNNDTYGMPAMRDVYHKQNTVVASKTIVVE